MLIDNLDLTYTDADIAGIANEGASALQNGDMEDVMLSLRLFSELLGFKTAPKLFQSAHCQIQGRLDKGAAGEMQFGPASIYDKAKNSLQFIVLPIDSRREDDLIYYRTILDHDVPADAEGGEVFQRLRLLVTDQKQVLAEGD